MKILYQKNSGISFPEKAMSDRSGLNTKKDL